MQLYDAEANRQEFNEFIDAEPGDDIPEGSKLIYQGVLEWLNVPGDTDFRTELFYFHVWRTRAGQLVVCDNLDHLLWKVEPGYPSHAFERMIRGLTYHKGHLRSVTWHSESIETEDPQQTPTLVLGHEQDYTQPLEDRSE
jgi:hypothetical protein